MTAAERQAILQEADHTLLSLAGESHYLLYRTVHAFSEKLAPLDSFYIGFCGQTERTIVYPYNFDGREYDDPNVNPYQPGGVTEWIVTNRRSYWSASDKGELLHRGRAFGNTLRRSAEGIVVPLFEKAGKHSPVLGLISVLSYTPNVYSKEHVWAMECLSESLGTALQREREDSLRRNRRSGRGFAPEMASADASPSSLFLEAGERLKRIRQRVEALRTLLAESSLEPDGSLVRAAEEIAQECARSQTETLDFLLHTVHRSEDLFVRLTTREREVASLLVAGQTNRQIAEALFVSEKTAKTHVGNIIQKLGAGGRSGVAQMLKSSLSAAYANGVETSPPTAD